MGTSLSSHWRSFIQYDVQLNRGSLLRNRIECYFATLDKGDENNVVEFRSGRKVTSHALQS